jgi:DNA-binding response OmpR family regulator
MQHAEAGFHFPTQAHGPRRNRRNRTVLCIFDDSSLIQRIEPEIVNRGFALLRARHGMHGFWMAINGQPDVILTDNVDPTQSSDYLLDCLRRHHKTASIPVVTLVSGTRQAAAGVTCLRQASLSLTKSIALPDLVRHIEQLLTRRRPASSEWTRTRRMADRVDSIFSEARHQTPPSPKMQQRPRGIRVPTRVARGH